MSDDDLKRLQQRVGRHARKSGGGRGLTEAKLLDVTGETTSSPGAYNYPAPVITDITGPAVTEKIMYPAQYGSPDMIYDGWYWAATVDTSRPGVYPYTVHVQLHELVEQNDELVWESVDLTCESSLKIINDPKRNGFTGAGVGVLPSARPGRRLTRSEPKHFRVKEPHAPEEQTARTPARPAGPARDDHRGGRPRGRARVGEPGRQPLSL